MIYDLETCIIYHNLLLEKMLKSCKMFPMFVLYTQGQIMVICPYMYTVHIYQYNIYYYTTLMLALIYEKALLYSTVMLTGLAKTEAKDVQ